MDRLQFETVVDAFAHAVEAGPDREAIRCDGRSLTYREYGNAVAALAARLTELGVAGQRAAVAMPNCLEAPVGILAALAAGAQAALFNPGYPPAALAPLLDDAAPTVVVGGDDDELRRLAEERGVTYCALTSAELDTLSSSETAMPVHRPRPDDLATLMYTGGTTGTPKGANHDHANLMGTVEGMELCWPTRIGEETWLSVAPVFHIWGLLMGVLNPMYRQARLILMSGFDPPTIVRLLEAERVTVFGGGPAAIYAGLLAVAGVGHRDLSSLRVCPGGGSPFSDGLLRRWEDLVGVPVYEAFGMSEAAPITANPYDGVRKAGSVGLPAPGMTVEIVAVDDGRTPLPTSEVGEIRVRSKRTFLGYRNRPDETANTLIDGWLYTGDIGRLDDDGYLYIVDRKKDMLLVGGFNVYPREIDEVLSTHPSVHESATIGVPDDRKGERPVSFVTPAPDQAVDIEKLMQLCAARLVDYKRPAAILTIEAIPKTPANKVDHIALRHRWTTEADSSEPLEVLAGHKAMPSQST